MAVLPILLAVAVRVADPRMLASRYRPRAISRMAAGLWPAGGRTIDALRTDTECESGFCPGHMYVNICTEPSAV